LFGQDYGAQLEGGYRYALLPGVCRHAVWRRAIFNMPAFSETDATGGGLASTSRRRTQPMCAHGARRPLRQSDASFQQAAHPVRAWAHDIVSNPTLSATFQALPKN